MHFVLCVYNKCIVFQISICQDDISLHEWCHNAESFTVLKSSLKAFYKQIEFHIFYVKMLIRDLI